MYLDKKTQYSDFTEESLTYSIDNELILQSGLFGEYNKTNKPKLIIKSADEMTPEEIKSHKGDTIILGADSLSQTRKGISHSLCPKLHRDSTEKVFFPYNFIRQHLQ